MIIVLLIVVPLTFIVGYATGALITGFSFTRSLRRRCDRKPRIC